MEFPGGGGSTARPSGTENPGGWGGQTGKTLRGGGMDIFWNHTIKFKFFARKTRLDNYLTEGTLVCGAHAKQLAFLSFLVITTK